MKLGILGTRGIPNHYGGFEQFAAFVSVHLVERGHEVSVYCSSLHPYQESSWKGVNLIHCQDFEDKIGTAGQFIYDLNCILDSRKRDFDVLLQLGYTSSSVWSFLFSSKYSLATNMDGLEWKRSKFSKPVQTFLKKAESWAVKASDVLIADSIGIQDYLRKKYELESTYIAYGAELFEAPDEVLLEEFDLKPYQYHLLVARIEPENNIQTILEGYAASKQELPFVVIGKMETPLAESLQAAYASNPNIRFIGGVYDQLKLNNLRHFSNLYFHGHSVGGTNPSLLEAMACSALVAPFDCIFNRSIIGDEAFYFENSNQVKILIDKGVSDQKRQVLIAENRKKIAEEFSWEAIASAYENLLCNLVEAKSK